MNKDQIQGEVEQLKGKIKEIWGRLSDDDIELVNGKQEQFLGKLQSVYGLKKEEAEKQYHELSKLYDGSSNKAA